MTERFGDVLSPIDADETRAELKRGHIRTWRLKAEELRTMADDMKTDAARRSMLNAAKNYERLADEAEGNDKPHWAQTGA
jgi:hypothetical protein